MNAVLFVNITIVFSENPFLVSIAFLKPISKPEYQRIAIKNLCLVSLGLSYEFNVLKLMMIVI